MRRVVRSLSLLLVAILLVNIFLWSADEGRKQQAQAVSVPFVSAPAFAEALTAILPSASTFALTGLALGTGVLIYYAGKQLWDWALNHRYVSTYGQTVDSNVDTASIIPDDVSWVYVGGLGNYADFVLDGQVHTSINVYDCDSSSVSSVPYTISSGSSFCTVTAVSTAFVDFACYNVVGWSDSSVDYPLFETTTFSLPVEQLCDGGVNTQKMLDDIKEGTFVPPAPAVISTVPIPDAPVEQIPDSAVTYQDADAIDWDGDGTNDTLIFPVPAGVSPSDVTEDVATLLPALDAVKDATVQNTEKLQDILATTTATVEQLKQLNATTASILPALRDIQNSTIAVEDSIDKLNDTVSALPEQIAQSISEQIAKESANVTAPDLPTDFVFPTDLDMPDEVDLSEKLSQSVPLPDVELNFSGTCSFPVALPWGGGSAEINFCQFDDELESVGVVLENLSKAFFIFWIFW